LGMTLSCKHHKSISFDSSLCFLSLDGEEGAEGVVGSACLCFV
jgi:hypothetical protein